MSSGCKLTTINYDVEEPHFKSNDNIVDKILNSLLKQANKSVINVAANLARRVTSARLHNGTQAASSDVLDENEKKQNESEGNSGPLLSGIAYCISSCSMILLNKVVLSSYGFDAGISLMLYQSAGADVNQELFQGYATTATAREGHCSILGMFLKAGASQAACEDALLEASLCGQVEAVKLLICSDMPRPNAVEHALVAASSRGFVDVVTTLIEMIMFQHQEDWDPTRIRWEQANDFLVIIS